MTQPSQPRMSRIARARESLDLAQQYVKGGVDFVVVPVFDERQELDALKMAGRNLAGAMHDNQ